MRSLSSSLSPSFIKEARKSTGFRILSLSSTRITHCQDAVDLQAVGPFWCHPVQRGDGLTVWLSMPRALTVQVRFFFETRELGGSMKKAVVNVQCYYHGQTILPTSCIPVKVPWWHSPHARAHPEADIERDGVHDLPRGCWRSVRSFCPVLTDKSAGPPETHPRQEVMA
jgi:hypothetical protein